jgi:rod shape-determining protein MreC
MQQIIYFLKKFRYFLLFFLLEIIAVFFTIQHHSYHKSKFVNSANFVTGGIYNKVNNLQEFFNLKTENKILIEENIQLKNLLNKISQNSDKKAISIQETTIYNQKYSYIFGKVINNNYTKIDNYLTLNIGTNDSIFPDLGVINSKGVIGVIKNVSPKFATVLSILNSESRINVRLKNSEHFGTMIWNGEDYTKVQIVDFPRQAQFKIGDTLITGGKSAIFPEGIPVGTITDFNFDNNQYNIINVNLFNNMSALGYVQIITNLEKHEQKELEILTENE